MLLTGGFLAATVMVSRFGARSTQKTPTTPALEFTRTGCSLLRARL